ncbi:MAG: hypothetical protein VB081_12575 [Christensenella sp.]|uniref:hypothetical protein n=1 Tax=Christensenella sp. TaxID=1935934 RepID=UPI002B2213ED|nr:hypothetical protein [Christensenella sp.]MEA5004314.1 hypothetical protein [Christensenella sp.]
MKLDRKKLDLAKARTCLSTAQLIEKANIPSGTYCSAIRCNNVRPETVGKIAKALGVDPAEIIKED